MRRLTISRIKLTIELDQEQLQSHNISLGQLGWQLRENNVSMSLGRVVDSQQRFMVRAIGEFDQAEGGGICPYWGEQLACAILEKSSTAIQKKATSG